MSNVLYASFAFRHQNEIDFLAPAFAAFEIIQFFSYLVAWHAE